MRCSVSMPCALPPVTVNEQHRWRWSLWLPAALGEPKAPSTWLSSAARRRNKYVHVCVCYTMEMFTVTAA